MGSISGNTTNPIMHVLLPLLFSFIAGLSIYIIASGNIHNQKSLGIVSICFSIFTIIGLHIGYSLSLYVVF